MTDSTTSQTAQGDTVCLLNPNLQLAELVPVVRKQAAKGDWALARRLLHYGFIRFPNSAQELQHLQHELSAFQQRSLQETHGLPARKFDFLILPSLRAGSSLLEQALNLHPQSLVVPKSELDQALLHGQLGGLLHRYRSQLANTSQAAAKSFGLVVHRFLMRADHIRASAQLLRQLVDGDLFIQIVRDPLQAFVSEFNHNFIETLLGDYRFDRIGMTQSENAVIKNAELKREQFFTEFVANKILYSTINSEFRKFFPRSQLLDFSQFAAGGEVPGIKRILNLIGVAEDYFHPLFTRQSYSLVHRVMERNWFALQFDKFTVNVRLGYAGQSILLPSAQVLELAHCASPNTDGLENFPLALCIREAQWESLPAELCRALIADGSFSKILVSQVLPSWLENWRIWKSLVDPFLISKLEGAWLNQALQHMRQELLDFSKLDANLVGSWQLSKY